MAFPAPIRRRLLNHVTLLPIITQQLEVDPSGRYEGVPHLVDIGAQIDFAGGVNAPKVMHVTDSEGRRQRQLVKSGSDDLRQVGRGQGVCVWGGGGGDGTVCGEEGIAKGGRGTFGREQG